MLETMKQTLGAKLIHTASLMSQTSIAVCVPGMEKFYLAIKALEAIQEAHVMMKQYKVTATQLGASTDTQLFDEIKLEFYKFAKIVQTMVTKVKDIKSEQDHIMIRLEKEFDLLLSDDPEELAKAEQAQNMRELEKEFALLGNGDDNDTVEPTGIECLSSTSTSSEGEDITATRKLSLSKFKFNSNAREYVPTQSVYSNAFTN